MRASATVQTTRHVSVAHSEEAQTYASASAVDATIDKLQAIHRVVGSDFFPVIRDPALNKENVVDDVEFLVVSIWFVQRLPDVETDFM